MATRPCAPMSHIYIQPYALKRHVQARIVLRATSPRPKRRDALARLGLGTAAMPRLEAPTSAEANRSGGVRRGRGQAPKREANGSPEPAQPPQPEPTQSLPPGVHRSMHGWSAP